jgi:DNA-binding transcriptional LysR family regulator
MEIHQIRYFLAVERLRNFTHAAAACNVTQPALTRAIRKLESEVGGLVFYRRQGKIEPTELGRTLLPHLQSIYEGVRGALSQAAQVAKSKKQRLRLGLMCTLGPARLLVLINTLAKRVPDLEVYIEEGKANDVIEQLIADEIDVAIACHPRLPAEVRAMDLFQECYCVAFAPNHRFAEMNEVALNELIGEDYLERLNCEFDDYYAAHFGDQPFELNVRYSSAREDWVQAMIVAGLGVSIVPENLPMDSRILLRPLTEPRMERRISVLTVRGRPFSPVAEAFKQTIASVKWDAPRA